MGKRHKDFDEHLAEQMEDLEFAQCYLLAGVEQDGETVEEALRRAIIATGIKQFSEESETRIQYVSDFVNERINIRVETLDKFLRVFGLKIKLGLEKVA